MIVCLSIGLSAFIIRNLTSTLTSDPGKATHLIV